MKLQAQRIWLFVVPVIALTLYASYLHLRANSQPQGLHLVLDRIESTSSRSLNYSTSVVMYLRAQGQWPVEVTNIAASSVATKPPRWGMSDDCDLYYKQNGQWRKYQWPKGKPSVLYPAAIYDQEYGGFVREYSINLSAIPANLKPLYCKVRTSFYLDVAKSWRGKGVPMKVDAMASGSIRLR